jgi:hypothetical protein
MFLNDGRPYIDCLDGSDKIDPAISYEATLTRFSCNTIPTFVCEERTCRYPHSLSCGNVLCIPFDTMNAFSDGCFSGRHLAITRVLLTSNDDVSNIASQQVLRCLIRISNNVSNPCSSSLITHCSA